jgi:hypothetical protein
MNEVVSSYPVIIRFVNDQNMIIGYNLYLEGELISPTASFKKATLSLIATYYTFNISYPKLLGVTYTFLQSCIFNIPQKKQLPASVTSLKSKLYKIM